MLAARSDVTAWAYTRSWRVPELLPALERLRLLPNVQLFASMDKSTVETPPAGWRRAWIDGDGRLGNDNQHIQTVLDGAKSYICPEQTKRKASCQKCGYCFAGKRGDVTFLQH